MICYKVLLRSRIGRPSRGGLLLAAAEGPGGQSDQAAPGEFDVVADDVLDLASQLGT